MTKPHLLYKLLKLLKMYLLIKYSFRTVTKKVRVPNIPFKWRLHSKKMCPISRLSLAVLRRSLVPGSAFCFQKCELWMKANISLSKLGMRLKVCFYCLHQGSPTWCPGAPGSPPWTTYGARWSCSKNKTCQDESQKLYCDCGFWISSICNDDGKKSGYYCSSRTNYDYIVHDVCIKQVALRVSKCPWSSLQF